MSKRLLIVVALAAMVLAGTAAVPTLRGMGGFGSNDGVPVFEVARCDFVRQVHADGTLEAVHATPLTLSPRLRTSMKIAWIAPEGTEVKAGDVVIRFDPTDIEKQLDDGLTERAKTDSRIVQRRVRDAGALGNMGLDSDLADTELSFANEFDAKDPQIFTRHEIIEAEIDQTLARQRKTHVAGQQDIQKELGEVELDLLGIERRKAELTIEQAETQLAELEIRAPHDGILVLQDTWQGPPQVGLVVWAGMPIAQIPRLDEMKAEVFVLEADAGGLETGQRATLVVEGRPDRVYEARVQHVDALAKRRTRQVPVQYFEVSLELAETEAEVMKPGQRVTAVIELESRPEVLTVPRQAVFSEDGASIVYVRHGGSFEPRGVRLGPAGLGRVIVEEGLEEGDLVALQDPTRPAHDPGAEGESSEGAPTPGASASL